MQNKTETLEREIATTDTTTIGILNSSEINQQIATAHRYPRDITKVVGLARQLVTMSEQAAQDCIYAVARAGDTVEGPSARFAEIMAHCWGNCRAGARTIDDAGDFVTAQGVFHDLEQNVAITYEVRRRIVDKKGKRYSADMIGVTANAACSIAVRNAVLKGIPKTFWSGLYEAARERIIGDSKQFTKRRGEALKYLANFGATEDRILAALGIRTVDEITTDHLVTLRGLATTIKDGDTTLEQAFPAVDKPGELKDQIKEKQ